MNTREMSTPALLALGTTQEHDMKNIHSYSAIQFWEFAQIGNHVTCCGDQEKMISLVLKWKNRT
ncbi:hypothetical protein FHX42_001192 [Saccharopolyspora lacisalsi]|uniref:Uncharacterized protein n=1 Tax=Halosaccharopolyspora lacisalsi TaxID=1000566 RepID=A0A839DS06_9PSEU|nr:hypothetical protein [Halosaccharopolyspora lacisalsi]MBA8823863.1 hypothetical protein [Halosaccharopolyspora lacisalsi]